MTIFKITKTKECVSHCKNNLTHRLNDNFYYLFLRVHNIIYNKNNQYYRENNQKRYSNPYHNDYF